MPLMQRAGGGRLYEGITGVGNDGTANAQCFGIVQCASGAIYSMAMDNPTSESISMYQVMTGG